MKKYNIIITAVAGILFLASCRSGLYVEVSNPLECDRHPEVVELCADSVKDALGLAEGEVFVVRGKGGKEVPYQITYDGKVVFPVQLAAGETAEFRLCNGTPSDYAVKVCGKHYPERVDDICWENDLVGFRVYGFKEDNPSGYDLFTKRSTDLPVIEEMYRIALDSEMKRIQKELEKENPDSAHRYNCDHRSFHVDHGFGADCYGVGPTLGAGVAALLDDGGIVYPACYDSYEILDNGPIRFTLKLTFRPFALGECGNVVETRVLTLDLGSHFTRTSVTYSGLDKSVPAVSGIVVHDNAGEAVGNAEKGYIAYPAPTINYDKQKHADNGTIFVGHVFPYELSSTGLEYFSDEESQLRGGSKGHILAHATYDPSEPFIYWWGFGWSHSDVTSYEQWLSHLETFAAQLRAPLLLNSNLM